MAGIYIHIPFCNKACHYCNFHFSTNKIHLNDFVQSLLTEIELRTKQINFNEIETIYFGGGTPSLLLESQLSRIIESLHRHFNIKPDAEITIECNPDNINTGYLYALNMLGFNRLSIGIQSFHDKHLLMMNRSHNSAQAISSIKQAQDSGFENITVDLIYGLPDLSLEEWRQNLHRVLSMSIPHLSCYSLTVEERTALAHFVKNKTLHPADDESTITQYEEILQWSIESGIAQYEISNFALKGFESKHNTSYWKGIPYIGLGPSAHSYYNGQRIQNKPNNASYIKSLMQQQLPDTTIEVLAEKDFYNEFIMTRLRTVQGFEYDELKKFSGISLTHFNKYKTDLMRRGLLLERENSYRLSKEGQMLSDYVISTLFVDD